MSFSVKHFARRHDPRCTCPTCWELANRPIDLSMVLNNRQASNERKQPNG